MSNQPNNKGIEQSEYRDKVIAINRVTKTTKGGRTFSFAAIVVVGNQRGKVGYGLGKAKEVQGAIAKGIQDAKKNMVEVPLIKGTLPHDQFAKFGASRVMLKPAAPGTGVIAGGTMRAVLETAGVTDVLTKSLGANNAHNVLKATFRALCLLRTPQQVAKARSIRLEKVYRG